MYCKGLNREVHKLQCIVGQCEGKFTACECIAQQCLVQCTEGQCIKVLCEVKFTTVGQFIADQLKVICTGGHFNAYTACQCMAEQCQLKCTVM